MSKQLTFSATLCALAMAALALVMTTGGAEDGGTHRAATAHGSLFEVMLAL